MKDAYFTTGGTLASDSPSYVERQADRDLHEGLLRGEYCYVLTSRQMGKSSLMVRAGLRFREQGVRVVLLDLTALGRNMTSEQWYEGMAEVLGEQLGLEDEVLEYWDRRRTIPPLRRWMSLLKDVILPAPGIQARRHAGTQAVGHSGGQGSHTDTPTHSHTDTPAPLIIFIDEIDAVLSLPFDTDEFFAGIRECYNRRSSDPAFRKLTFCLLGVATPSDLIRDVRTTPFNIGRRIELTDFTQEEAGPLVPGLLRENDVSQSPANPKAAERQANLALQRVLYWTDGHPYLTQRLCRAVAEDPAGGDGKAVVDARCRELFLSSKGWERDDNLLFVRDRLLRTGADLAALLELLGRIRAGRRVSPDETNPILDLLRLSGIIRVDDAIQGRSQNCEVRNRIYAEVFDRAWIRRHMPDAEIQRQRAAFRRGVARTAALAGVVLTIMLLLMLTAVDRAREAHEAQLALGGANGSLRRSLRSQKDLNLRLGTALEDSRKAQVKATRAVQSALAAGRREREQRRDAEQARGAAVAAELTANRAKREALDRLSRACIDVSTRAASTGDLLGALPPLADALKLDQGNAAREPIHRLRLAYLLGEGPRLQDMWSGGSEVRSLAVSADGKLAAAGCDGGAVCLVDLQGRGRARDFIRNAGSVVDLAFSPDGSRLAVADEVGTARVWDVRTGRPLTPPLAGLGRLQYLAWHPTGRRIAVGGENGAVVWDIRPVRKVSDVRFPRAESCQPAFSPDGRKLAIIAGNHLGWMVDPSNGTPLYHLGRCFNGTAVEFSPDGSSLLIAGAFGSPVTNRGAAILDVNTGAPLRYLEMPAMGSVARFSGDGRRVLLGDRGGGVQVWDASTGAPVSPLIQLGQAVTAASLSPDGRRVVAGSRNGIATVLDAMTGSAVCAPLRQGRWVSGAAFSGNSRRVLTTSRDGALRIWEVPARQSTPDFAGAGAPGAGEELLRVDHLAGDRWAVGTIRRTSPGAAPQEAVRVWNSRTGKVQAPGRWRRYAVSSDKRWLALAGEAGVQLWDAATGKAGSPLHPIDLSTAELSLQPHGRWLATFVRKSGPAGPGRIVDLRTGRIASFSAEPVASIHGFFDAGQVLWYMTERGSTMLWRVPGDGEPWAVASRLPLIGTDAAVIPASDSRMVVTSTGPAVFRAWDGRGRPLARELRFDDAHPWAPRKGVAIDTGSRRAVVFAVGHQGRRSHGVGTVLDLAAGTALRLLGGDTMPMFHAATFAPVPDRFAAYSTDGQIQVWDARTGRPITGVMHHSTLLPSISFSRDGRRLLTGAVDGTARVWDATTGRPLTPFLSHSASVEEASFSPDGRLVLTRSADGVARIWDSHTGEGVLLPLALGLRVDQCRFLPDSRHVLAHCGPRTVVRTLLPDGRSIPELARQCLLLAAHRADGNGGLEALEPEQLRAMWRKHRP